VVQLVLLVQGHKVLLELEPNWSTRCCWVRGGAAYKVLLERKVYKVLEQLEHKEHNEIIWCNWC
jgi:hypothetical protein